MPLATIEQQSFRAGEFDGVARNLIPPEGLAQALNGLLNDDYLIYKRGGTKTFSDALTANAVRFLWAGYLGPGERIVYADVADFGVLNGTAPVNIGGAGMTAPKRAAELGGVLAIGGGVLYGGSRKTADYTTGTIGVTQFSKTVTGTGFTANVDAGMLLRPGGTGRWYVVASVDSNTSLTLRDTYQGSTNAAITFQFTPLTTTGSSNVYRTSDIYIAVGGRLLSCEGNRVYESDFGTPNPGENTSGQGLHKWTDTDYHELPDGVAIIGGDGVGNLAVIGTTRGVFTISGLTNDLTDSAGNVQQAVSHVHPDLILWHNNGIASFGGALIFPATDGVYLVDGVSTPRNLSLSIPRRYRSYVEAGYAPGIAAVHRGHYLLPVFDSSNVFVDLLVCRLDRPAVTRNRPTYYQWSHLSGSGANNLAFVERNRSPAAQPQLLCAENFANGRIADASGYFDPASAIKADRDGTIPFFDVITRDLELGKSLTQTKRLEVSYELDDAATDNPHLAAAVQIGEGDVVQLGADWDMGDWDVDDWASEGLAAFTGLDGSAPEDPEGDDPYLWPVNVRARYARFRLYSADPVAKLVLKGLRLFVRPNRKDY